ncbi:hypothetical protein U9M48_035750 [Paspalum notatum var. saurae]|uniref:Uncharacterized protein n=1 Tax=Paspalum notatum var. saurae TaxID=547442 RepID=A0AAQ3UD94_PASNO
MGCTAYTCSPNTAAAASESSPRPIYMWPHGLSGSHPEPDQEENIFEMNPFPCNVLVNEN